jgi:putative sugar O-methyltransferase
MSLSRTAAQFLKSVLARFGFLVIRRSTAQQVFAEYPWLGPQLGLTLGKRRRLHSSASPNAPSPSDPRLADLRRRYQGLRAATSNSVWRPEYLETELDLSRFREDNAYVWQTRISTPIQYMLSAYYVKEHDPLGLSLRLQEDGEFGAYRYEHNGWPISRDVLDSIMEMNFLENCTGLSRIEHLTVLDIGAGYGRLAHRMAESLPNLHRYLCADAVPESTFLSDFYTKFRKVNDRVIVVPLDEIEQVVSATRIDVALNIHSFSECSLDSIEFWLDLVQKAKVPWLFIVPNTADRDRLISSEADRSRKNFRPSLTARGYDLIVQREKYDQSPDTQKYGLFPSTYFLFRLRQ